MSSKHKQKSVYWDSCTFLKHLMEEPGHELCDDVIAEAESGNLVIVTSTLTIAEVLNIKGCQEIPAENRAKVEQLFNQDFIEVRAVTRKTALLARDIVWTERRKGKDIVKVKPKDAIHVATAIEAEMMQMHTFDDGLIGLSGLVGGTPNLQISKPRVNKTASAKPTHKQEVLIEI